MKSVDIRVDVLRNNVKVTELNPRQAPRILSDTDGEIKTSFRGSFAMNDEVNLLTDEISPVLIIDGQEMSLGRFGIATYEISHEINDDYLTIEAYDRCWVVQSYATQNIVHLSAGTNYITAIKSLLTQCGIGLINADPTNLTLATDREDWEIGTSYLEIINTLLDEISYRQLVFDNNGIAVLSKKPSTTQPPVRQYSYNDINTLISDTNTSVDIYEAPNVFICVCDNADNGAVWTATAVNDYPQSPLSVNRRGRRICSTIKVDNIASAAELQNYANYLVINSMFISETITIQTNILPDVLVYDTVAVVHPKFSGLCREKSWSIELEPNGVMNHTLEASVLSTNEESASETVSATIAGIAIAGLYIVGVSA